MLTCGECAWIENGKCMKSGHLDVEPMKVNESDTACESFEMGSER